PTARPFGPPSPVAAPTILAIGTTLPDAPAMNSSTELSLLLETKTSPAPSRAMPNGPWIFVFDPAIRTIGDTLPNAPGGYSVTELAPWLAIQIPGATMAGTVNAWSVP